MTANKKRYEPRSFAQGSSRCCVTSFFRDFVFHQPACYRQLSDNDSAQPVLNRTRHRSYIASSKSVRAVDARISVRRLKVPHKARELYEKALAAWARLASPEAEHKLDQALRLDSEFPDALALRGAIQAFHQQWESAEQSLQAAIVGDPSYSPPYLILAAVYNSEERFDEARQVSERALSAGGDNWSVQYEIARSFIGKRKYESALAVTELSLRSDQHGCLMHLAKAHALLGLRRYVEAVAELRTFVHDQPSGDGSQDARELLERLQTVVLRQPGNPPATGIAR